MIDAQDIDLSFDGVQLVLKGVTLTVKTGEFVALAGPSGCGKTTLLNLCAGLVALPEGQKLTVVREKPQLGSSEVAYMLARDSLFPWLNALDNAAFGLKVRGTPVALWKHGVVFFRKQVLKPDSYLRLGAKFGEMEKHEFFPHLEGHPQIQLISHEGNDAPETDRWHTDVTFRKKPNMVSILRITDLPPSGGDTMWASTAAAYDALGPGLQSLLEGLQAEHDLPFHFRRINAVQRLMERQALAKKKSGGMMSSMMSADEMNSALADRECKLINDNPSVVHPAVITHPFNGRNLLFVNSIWTKRLLGVHMDLSEALLNMLYEWMKKPEFMVRFRWEENSLAMWDNCQTQHYAVFDYAPHYRAGQRVTSGSFVPTLSRGGASSTVAQSGSPVRQLIDQTRLQASNAQERHAVDAIFRALEGVDLDAVASSAQRA